MLKEQLRKARKAAGKTQQEVADHLGVDYSTYSGYETGKRQPDALKIKKIAAFLGVTGDYLLEISLDQPYVVQEKNEKNTILCETSDEIRLISCYRTLNSAGKAAVMSAAEGIASNPDLREEKSKSTTA